MSESCLECAACCRQLVVRITLADMRREPVLAVVAQDEPDRPTTKRLMPQRYGEAWKYSCPMLEGTRCSIYATRPDVCRAFQRGSPECRMARLRHGKEPIDE